MIVVIWSLIPTTIVEEWEEKRRRRGGREEMGAGIRETTIACRNK